MAWIPQAILRPGYLSAFNYVTVGTLANQAQTIAGFSSGGTLALTAALTQNILPTVNVAATGASDALTIALTASGDVDYLTAAVATLRP